MNKTDIKHVEPKSNTFFFFLCEEPVSKPHLTTEPRMEDISEGYNMTLVCSVQRGSFPINFTWYSLGKGFLDSKTSRKLKESHSISNVKGDHAGGYYCECTNPAAEPKQSAIIIIGGVCFIFS